MTKYNYSIYVFTRDLRLYDNYTLNKASKESKHVIPIFVFNDVQVDKQKNSFKSDNCVQFMCETLDELNDEIKKHGSKLYFFKGDTENIINKIIKEKEIDAIFISEDYTPFAKKRQNQIQDICSKNGIEFNCIENHMLTDKTAGLKDDGNPYVKFTPYHRHAKKKKINPIETVKKFNFVSSNLKFEFEYKKDIHNFYDSYNENLLVNGGRSNADKILKHIEDYKKYNEEREIPSIKGTTYLSAYLKFGVVSPREVYYAFKKKLSLTNKLFTQLYWRDFYMSIMYYYPDVLKGPMREKYKKLKWDNDAKKIKAWKEGKTGVPIVDAGMREMLTTGYMHNRLRLITSNFLIKILRCNWQIGEKFFAQNLVDYDPANNNGNWQWGAGTGTDSQPYFRVFNPWRQSESYDKNCEYIKKWIPELNDVEPKHILRWYDYHDDSLYKKTKYPSPIVTDIKKESAKTVKMYASV